METTTVDREVVDLVDRARDGDAAAFADLYDRYVDLVYAFVRRRIPAVEIAEDLTADVFLRALHAIRRFRWQGVDVGAWLLTIARNRVTDHFRSARVRLDHSVPDVFDEPSEDPRDAPERVALARETARALGAALRQLKPEHQEVLQLRFVDGLTLLETAAHLKRSEGAVKALQHRAMRSLAAIVRSSPRPDAARTPAPSPSLAPSDDEGRP